MTGTERARTALTVLSLAAAVAVVLCLTLTATTPTDRTPTPIRLPDGTTVTCTIRGGHLDMCALHATRPAPTPSPGWSL